MSTILYEKIFLEQCQLLCFFYIKNYSFYDKDCDREDQKHLIIAVENEIKTLSDNCNCDDISSASQFFAKQCSDFDISSVGKVASSVKLIWHGDLTEDNFNVAADSLSEAEQISNWKEISLLLYLMYRTLIVRGISELDDIVNLTSKYLSDHAEIFVTSEDGWSSVGAEEQEYEEEDVAPEEILSSIVMVQQEESIRDIPPSESPPFSILTPPAEEEEKDSLNSATPPEIVDRPPMTSSIMQMLGAGDVSNNGASSDSTEFEMIASAINSASVSCPSSPKEMPDDVIERSCDETINKQTLSTHLQSFAASEAASSKSKDSVPEEASVSDYLPQISLGVAAAAACIGFFVLKKATA